MNIKQGAGTIIMGIHYSGYIRVLAMISVNFQNEVIDMCFNTYRSLRICIGVLQAN